MVIASVVMPSNATFKEAKKVRAVLVRTKKEQRRSNGEYILLTRMLQLSFKLVI
jgi:ribosomal protein L14